MGKEGKVCSMPVSIVASASANYAQVGVRVRSDLLSVNTQKLTSGLRVFSAQEDAAALAIGTGLRIENAALKTAMLNATSGVSMLQIADGALGQIGDMITRMQVLAGQASSGHLDAGARAIVQTEFASLQSEVDRVARGTEFNDIKMLAGSKAFNVTAAADYSLDGIVSPPRFDQTIVTGSQLFRYSYNATTEALTVARVDGGASSSQTIDLSALLDSAAGAGQNLSTGQLLDVSFASMGVTLTLNSTFDRTVALAPTNTLAAGASISMVNGTLTLPPNNQPLTAVTALGGLTSGYNVNSGVLTLPLTTDATVVRLGSVPGISYRVNAGVQGASGAASDDLVGASNTVQIYADVPSPGTGTVLVGTWTTGAVSTLGGTTSGSIQLGVGDGMIAATYTNDNAATRLTYKVGTGIVSGQDTVVLDLPATTTSALGINLLNVSTQTGANTAVDALKVAVDRLNEARSAVGAQQLRLEQVGRNLGVVTENNEAARSALLDVDVANEITDYTTNQTMLQASLGMLQKANQFPQFLLELLRNS